MLHCSVKSGTLSSAQALVQAAGSFRSRGGYPISQPWAQSFEGQWGVGSGSEVRTRPVEDEPIPGFSDELPFSRRVCRWHADVTLRHDAAMQDRFRRCTELAGPGHMACEWCSAVRDFSRCVFDASWPRKWTRNPKGPKGWIRRPSSPSVLLVLFHLSGCCLHATGMNRSHPIPTVAREAERSAGGSKTSSKASASHHPALHLIWASASASS